MYALFSIVNHQSYKSDALAKHVLIIKIKNLKVHGKK